MGTGEFLFLALVLVAFVGFAATLAFYSSG
jgi:hypothetical protein